MAIFGKVGCGKVKYLEILGQRIRQLRERKGMSQDDLGKVLSLGRAAIGHYESGFRNPDPPTLQRIADYFSVSADWLLGRTDDPRGLKQLMEDAVKEDKELAEFWEAFLKGGSELRVAFRHIKDLDAETLRTLVRVAKAIEKEESTSEENMNDRDVS
jgi:transcriptional regulator with XRE-family HTH domain